MIERQRESHRGKEKERERQRARQREREGKTEGGRHRERERQAKRPADVVCFPSHVVWIRRKYHDDGHGLGSICATLSTSVFVSIRKETGCTRRA